MTTFVLCLSLLQPAAPGDVLTFRATVSAEVRVVVVNPLWPRPLYACNGRPLMPGFRRRVAVTVGRGSCSVDGVQLADGRVWINGQAVVVDGRVVR